DDAVLQFALVNPQGKVVIEGERQTDFSALPGNPPPTKTMRVSLSFGNVTEWTSGNISSDGAFSISDVPPGRYDVLVSGSPPGTFVKEIRLGSHVAVGGVVDVPDGGGESLQILLSRSMGEIRVAVKTAAGTPALTSTVLILSEPL